MGVLWLAGLLAACANKVRDTVPVDPTTVGSENEPVIQQMRRRLRPTLGGGPLEGGIVVDVPPREEGGPPFSIKTILVTDRTSSSISLRWHDRSNVEDGTRLRRREATGGWQDVQSFGPSSGFNDVTDTGLSPDHLYCYQFVGFNEHGESPSPQRCAYTRGAEARTVFRAQLTIQTADVENAGTNDRVTVRLNSPPSIFVPSGNITMVDYGRNDFQRGDRFTYDLELTALADLEDVTLLHLSKSGGDGWCLERLELSINNRRVFARDLARGDDPCLWLDTGGERSTSLTVTHEELRSHADWMAFVQTFPLAFDRDEIESRIEGTTGHFLAGNEDADWGDRLGRAWVEATKKTDEMVHIDLDLEAEVPGNNPSVDIDFDVTFRFTLRDDEFELDITTSNLETDVDFDWFTETLSAILPCAPIAGVASRQVIADCIFALEKYLEDEIRRGWQPIARHFLAGTPCPAGSHPEARVNDFEGELTNVSFGCALDEGPALGNEPNGVQ
jgi:hypothetical protein